MTLTRLLPLWSVAMVATMAMMSVACNNDTPSTEGLGGSAGSTHGLGGAAVAGGAVGSGGRFGSGGSDGVGGASAHGGTSGGSVTTGGSTGSGGVATGGTVSTGGNSATGGGSATGGMLSTGGILASGGRAGTGGSTMVGTGGAGGSSTVRDAGADAGAGVTYSDQVSKLLSANCTSCHSGSRPSGGIDLSSYTSAKTNASRANREIQSGAMPPGAPLSAANKQLFQSWVTAGEPN